MSDEKLRVLPRGTARVQDYAALMGSGVNRFHGWKLDTTVGKPFVDPDTKQPRRHAVYVKTLGTENVVEIDSEDPHFGEYVRHLRAGDLWPADIATAQMAGVKFDATFGNEHGPDAKAQAKADLDALVARHGKTPTPGAKPADASPPNALKAPAPSEK